MLQEHSELAAKIRRETVADVTAMKRHRKPGVDYYPVNHEQVGDQVKIYADVVEAYHEMKKVYDTPPPSTKRRRILQAEALTGAFIKWQNLLVLTASWDPSLSNCNFVLPESFTM